MNNTRLQARIGDIFVGTSEGSAYIYDPNYIPLHATKKTANQNATQVGIAVSRLTESTFDNSDATETQIIELSDSTEKNKVTLEGGDQSIQLNNAGGNVVVVATESTGDKNIAIGGGNNMVVVEDTETPVSITAGAGKDTIVTAGNNVSVDMNGGEIDFTGELENTLLIGNIDVTRSPSKLTAGLGNDTALGGAGDFIDLGSGRNKISLSSYRSVGEGATIALTADNGITDIEGFRTGFVTGSDNIQIDPTSTVTFKDGTLKFSNGGASLLITVSGSAADLAESADLFDDTNFVDGTTLSEVMPITYEQGDYQNIYAATNFTSQETITAAFAE